MVSFTNIFISQLLNAGSSVGPWKKYFLSWSVLCTLLLILTHFFRVLNLMYVFCLYLVVLVFPAIGCQIGNAIEGLGASLKSVKELLQLKILSALTVPSEVRGRLSEWHFRDLGFSYDVLVNVVSTTNNFRGGHVSEWCFEKPQCPHRFWRNYSSVLKYSHQVSLYIKDRKSVV